MLFFFFLSLTQNNLFTSKQYFFNVTVFWLQYMCVYVINPAVLRHNSSRCYRYVDISFSFCRFQEFYPVQSKLSLCQTVVEIWKEKKHSYSLIALMVTASIIANGSHFSFILTAGKSYFFVSYWLKTSVVFNRNLNACVGQVCINSELQDKESAGYKQLQYFKHFCRQVHWPRFLKDYNREIRSLLRHQNKIYHSNLQTLERLIISIVAKI